MGKTVAGDVAQKATSCTFLRPGILLYSPPQEGCAAEVGRSSSNRTRESLAADQLLHKSLHKAQNVAFPKMKEGTSEVRFHGQILDRSDSSTFWAPSLERQFPHTKSKTTSMKRFLDASLATVCISCASVPVCRVEQRETREAE